MAKARYIRTTVTRLRDLHRRIERHRIEDDDWAILGSMVFKEIVRAERRFAKMLEKLNGARRSQKKSKPPLDSQDDEDDVIDDEVDGSGSGKIDENDDDGLSGAREDEDTPQEESCSSSSSSENANDVGPDEPNAGRKGHGRNGAGAYAAADHCNHALEDGIIGGLCEACSRGSVARYRDKLVVVITGQPLFGAEVHHIEQGRCNLCKAIIRAKGTAEISRGIGSNYIIYDWSACAMLLVMHYFSGVPFQRIESLQAGWGIPMPDANQWEIADKSADLLLPLYRALEKHGVNHAIALRIDDTGSMIISVKREIRNEIAALAALGKSTKDVRTGINATGVYLETAQGKVLLFFTGRHHAGEIIDQILKHRTAAQSKIVKVSDAASKNFTHTHQDEFEEAVCNAHAYLKFRSIKDKHPEEAGLAGEVYKKVFDNDDVAKAKGMTPERRMRYHQKHSLPEMERLRKMCHEKLESKLVEPNSPLWEPLTFIINQWERLTRFCEVPGVPLDSNVVEQMLIIPVRYLAASFNYKTQNGADVGDLCMSLIATANANGVEPVAYLTECLANHEDLAERPEYYFPWVYRARLEASNASMQAHPRVSASPSPRGQPVEHPLRPGPYRGPPRNGIKEPLTMTTT